MFHVKRFGPIGAFRPSQNNSPAGKAGLLERVPRLSPAAVPAMPTVPVHFFHRLRRRGCAHDTLVQYRHCGSTTFPESQGAERNSGRDSDFCKACAHTKFSSVECYEYHEI
jgi:hypothetical protein